MRHESNKDEQTGNIIHTVKCNGRMMLFQCRWGEGNASQD